MRTLYYLLLFATIQLASLVLFIVGLPIIGLLCGFKAWTYELSTNSYHFPKWAWIWDNEENGIEAPGYFKAISRLHVFYWSAFRNSCNNLRYVKGVSAVGRPLWWKTWTIKGKPYYAKAGWMSDGYPCLSAGAGQW